MDQRDPVADELAVRNLVARVAQLADMGEDLADYLACFAPDVVWQMPGAPEVRGHEALRAGAERRRASGEAGPGTHTRHMITTLAVDVEGDVAIAESYWLFLGNTHETPELRLTGYYRDRFERRPEGWKLAERQIAID